MELTATKNELTGRWNIPELEPSEKTFERMCDMLRNDVQFKFARYGDGEFFCMSGKVGRNCDKHEYFPDLGRALCYAFFDDPQYMVGIQPLSVQTGLYKKFADMWTTAPANLYNADALHNASIDGKLSKLFESIGDRPAVVVGPAHLGNMKAYFIEIPSLNCWLDFKNTLKSINYWLSVAAGYNQKPVFILCASMMSEVIIHKFKDADATFIDCGSVFDIYHGVKSRSYHHKIKL
jgi:hypothetical protein